MRAAFLSTTEAGPEQRKMDPALREAASAGELDRLMTLAGPRPNIDAGWACQACTVAGREGRVDFFEWLIEAGGLACAALGLEAACRAGRLDCARFLWETGARHDSQELLHAALENGRTEIVRWLCEEGGIEVGVFELVAACRSGNPKLVEWAGAGLEESGEALDDEGLCDVLRELNRACDAGRRRIATMLAGKLPQAWVPDGELAGYRDEVLAKYNAL